MEEKRKKDRAPLIVAAVLFLALLICLVLLAVRLKARFAESAAEAEKKKEIVQSMELDISFEIEETEMEVYRYLEDVYITRKKGLFGMSDLEGNCLVEPVYSSWVYSDRDWISFEDEKEVTYVFDRKGNLLYEYLCNPGPMTTEGGRNFYREVFYRQGMKIEFDYSDEDYYYGIHYYNAATDELIFELTDEMQELPSGGWEDFQVSSMPDETGMAIVIAGNGNENTIYRITKDGYTKENYDEEYVERRFYFYSSHGVWNETNQVNGWMLTTILEERGEILGYSEEWYEILFNVHTKERIVLPEEYQEWSGVLYEHSNGLYYGMSGESAYDYEEERTDNLYYAICHGSEKLTEEIYQWIDFGDTYIIAGNNSFSHILDYEGNVLAEYYDIAFPFVDGRTLVCDGIGAFFIDETLEKCSGYVMKGVDYCHPGYIRKGDKHYLIQWME